MVLQAYQCPTKPMASRITPGLTNLAVAEALLLPVKRLMGCNSDIVEDYSDIGINDQEI